MCIIRVTTHSYIFPMLYRIILFIVLSVGLSTAYEISFADITDVIMVTNCDGTRITRTAVGQLVITHIETDVPGCVGKSSIHGATQAHVQTQTQKQVQSQTGTEAVTIVTNCSGMRVTRRGTGVTITRVEKDLEQCIDTTSTPSGQYDASRGPALDLRSTDIVAYRALQMRNMGIRYADPIRSVKLRAGKSMTTRVQAYLMSNDSVIISGNESGWVSSQGTTITAPDQRSNTIISDTTGKASGYIARRYLRDPTASDLVRIEQADQAYWSDIAHVQVAHLVNVRAHPWYTAPIVATLTNQTGLYIVSTVDNWSEVISDDRTLHGYVRSDFLRVDQAQRVDR